MVAVCRVSRTLVQHSRPPLFGRGAKMPTTNTTNYSLDGTFVGVPVATICSEEWRLLKSYSRVVYITMLLKYWRDFGDKTVKWKQVEIAEESGLSLRTVQRGLRQLKDAGFIDIEKPGGRWSACATYCIAPEFADWNTECPKGTIRKTKES